ncbi:MAG: DoxX family protein [Candidatus Rokubacteria bacterium]|nr:DoxX family protein [Candidatus Rokubacteria bacterium]
MRTTWGIDPAWGVTAVRVAMGIILFMAGWQKMMGGLDGVSRAFAGFGIPVPGIAGPFIAVLELVGGALLILGLAGRWLGLLFAIEFVVAAFYVKFPGPGFNAGRIDIMLLAGAILVFLNGSGNTSIDGVWLEKEA